MRFVEIDTIQEGMELAKTIYGKNGEVMLKKGITVKTPFLKRLKQLGYPGLYINDSFSEDIIIEEVITEELRQKTTFTIKKIFNGISAESLGIKKLNTNIDTLKNLIEEIMSQIITSNIALINIRDLKNFDDYTYYHSVNVAVLCVVIGNALGLKKEQLKELGLSAILHDVGKMFIGSEIINKPELLTVEEYERVKDHSLEGYKYLKDDFNLPAKVYVSILQHHENYDGNGYPNGLFKEQIHIYARIIAVADVYDALTSARPYKKAETPNKALEFILQNEGVKFDPKIVKVVSEIFAPFPVGTFIKLTNGMMGIVLENFTNTCLKPKVKIFWRNDKPVTQLEINLRDDEIYRDVEILSIISGL